MSLDPMLKSPVGRLRAVSLSEGVSYVLLLGVAMPLKYLAGMPLAVRIIGSIHGALFLLLVVALIQTLTEGVLDLRKAAKVFAAALIPLGAFFIDPWLRREQAIAVSPAEES